MILKTMSFLLMLSVSQLLQASSDQPLFLAVFGDSVTKATMADEALGNPSARFYSDMLRGKINDGLYKKIKLPPLNPDREKFYRFNRLFGYMARYQYSWVMGGEEYSIKTKLQEKTGRGVEVYDGTIMGAGYFGHRFMLEDLNRWLSLRVFHKTPDIVILSLGGMDVAHNFPVEEFQENVRQFISGVTRLAPYAQVIITGIPNIIPVMTHKDRVAVPADSILGEITCQGMYKNMGFGQDLGLNDKSTDEQKEIAYSRIVEMRDVLEEEIALVKDQVLYPWFQGQVTYVDLDDPNDETVNWLAADCVHPDVRGQRLIGSEVWDAIRQGY